MSGPTDALIAARVLIEIPEHWTQGDWAKTKEGRACGALEDDAFCFCISGALLKACHGHGVSHVCLLEIVRTANNISTVQGFPGPWNDDQHRTHADVIAALDRAIKISRTENPRGHGK